jgi:hypothetical protein
VGGLGHRAGASRRAEGRVGLRGPLTDTRRSCANTSERLGDVANKLLFENELVRVWEMDLAPGERSDRHRHELPYLLCVFEGTGVDADVEGRGRFEIPVQPGSVFFVPPERRKPRSTRARFVFARF